MAAKKKKKEKEVEDPNLSKDNVDPETGMRLTPNDEGFNAKLAEKDTAKIKKEREAKARN